MSHRIPRGPAYRRCGGEGQNRIEICACSRFTPLLDFKIVHPPADYIGKSHQYMRAKENEAGREKAFIVIDEDAIKRHAVCYVDALADADAVERGEVESTEVVMKILVKTQCLASTQINYEIANMNIEDLDYVEVERPLKNDFWQSEVSDCSGLDMVDQQRYQDVEVTAKPDEFEENREKGLLDNLSPRPDKVGKHKDEVARAAGILASWTFIGDADTVDLPDGSQKTFPAGSVRL